MFDQCYAHRFKVGRMKKTIILGATTNTARYAYQAAWMLTERDCEMVPIGIKKGAIFGERILDLRKKPVVEDVDTITIYIGEKNQLEWHDYILSLKPKRIIFNPGAENPTLELLSKKEGIETLNACTLVMLSVGNY